MNGSFYPPDLNLKVDDDFPIRILDNMIQVEEDMKNGFSIYRRGNNLKKSLIDMDRVKGFLCDDVMPRKASEMGGGPPLMPQQL